MSDFSPNDFLNALEPTIRILQQMLDILRDERTAYENNDAAAILAVTERRTDAHERLSESYLVRPEILALSPGSVLENESLMNLYSPADQVRLAQLIPQLRDLVEAFERESLTNQIIINMSNVQINHLINSLYRTQDTTTYGPSTDSDMGVRTRSITKV